MMRFRLFTILQLLALVCTGCQPSPAPQPSTEAEAPLPILETPAHAPEPAVTASPDEVAAWAEKSGAQVKKDAEGNIVLLDFTKVAITDEDIQRLTGQKYLKELRLGGCPIGNTASKILSGVPLLETL